MPLSQSDLRTIAGTASTLVERLISSKHVHDQQVDDHALHERLSAWCQASTGGDWQRFQQRLSWDGLDLDGALRLLAPASWPEHAHLPAWTTTLQAALQMLENRSDEGQWPFLDPGRPLPFEVLLAHFVALAQQRLLSQTGSLADVLSSEASITLQQHLLHTLVSLSMPTLHAEFEHTRTHAQATGGQIDEQSLYRSFLQHMRQGGLASLLCQYSVLGRLLATTCDLWVEANVELLQRLATDKPDLEHIFRSGSSLGQVSEIQPALSDVHTERRSVMALTFASGCRVIYKPRPVGMEEAYYHLLHWCNLQGATPQLKTLAVLNRTTYGWMEYVEQRPCHDTKALQRYYRRSGMLLCLVYMLGGVDCFYDQFIAAGEQPVLVDASHLLQPFIRPTPQCQEGEDWEQALYSVLHTGLLASWPMPASEPAVPLRTVPDVSGLGLKQEYLVVTQEQAQTHRPMLKYGSFKPRRLHNVITLADAAGSEHGDVLRAELSLGFQSMYQLLLERRQALLSPDSPLQKFNKQVVHFFYRDRSSYEKLLPSLLTPQMLKDAVTRDILCDPLGLTCVPLDWFRMGKRDFTHWWAVFVEERQALLQGDIPVVQAYTHEDALLIAQDQKLASCLCQPSFELLMSRVKQLSNEDMFQQLALLKQALPSNATPTLISSKQRAEQPTVADEQASTDPFMAQALAIADDIAAHAIKVGDESVLWVNTSYAHYQYYQLRPMRYGFSDGIGGIAFFLAALAKQTGLARYRRLASAAMRPLHRLLREEGARLRLEMGLGACPGLGSLVYTLTRIGQFLDDEQMVETARATANLITREYIAGDHLLDVHLGTAGAILGLLALYEVMPAQNILDHAMSCGEHLLRARTRSNADCLAWPTLGGNHTTGFAHGTAGIVYALLRLYAVTGEADLLHAAQEGLRYEDRAFNPELGNWAEVVGTANEANAGVSWCHGAPGIGLARLGGLSILHTPSIQQDVECALQTTQQIGNAGLDHLCCGMCGRIEFLLTASQRLKRPELASEAAHMMDQVLSRAERRGTFVINLLLPAWVSHPHFFQGTSGIGYTLLRLAQPAVLPSPLLWE